MKINRLFFSLFCSLSLLGSCAVPERKEVVPDPALPALPFTGEAAAVLEEKIGGYTATDVRVQSVSEASENSFPTVIEGEFLPDFHSYEEILLDE